MKNTMQRLLVLTLVLVLTSCSGIRLNDNLSYPERVCPGFVSPNWQLMETPVTDSKHLLAKQKFAVLPEQQTVWFSARQMKYLGLCIPPIRTRRATNDCGTIYVTYVRKQDDWQLLEQKVTICPGG